MDRLRFARGSVVWKIKIQIIVKKNSQGHDQNKHASSSVKDKGKLVAPEESWSREERLQMQLVRWVKGSGLGLKLCDVWGTLSPCFTWLRGQTYTPMDSLSSHVKLD